MGSLPSTSFETRKNHKIEAHTTDNLLAVMVVTRVFNRLGAISIQRPILEEKHIDARVVTIPLYRILSALCELECVFRNTEIIQLDASVICQCQFRPILAELLAQSRN